MAIYGIGAIWDDDKLSEFIRDGKACVGWWPDDSSALYHILKGVKTGDLIYIKSSPPGSLYIKAVGMVTDDNSYSYDNNAASSGVKNCIKVKWMWTGQEVIEIKNTSSRDKGDPYVCGVYRLTLYEEHNEIIQQKILSLI
jgi:hypothetical protein